MPTFFREKLCHVTVNQYCVILSINFYYLVTDETLPGLYIGISTMRKGEKSQFLLSPKYGFLEMGCPPRVPPAATGMCKSLPHDHVRK